MSIKYNTILLSLPSCDMLLSFILTFGMWVMYMHISIYSSRTNFSRELSRTIILEFNRPNVIFRGAEKASVFNDLYEKKSVASSVIGQLIHLAYHIYQIPQLKTSVSTSLPSEISDQFDTLLPRLFDTYSIWFYTLLKVCPHNASL